MGYIQSLGQAMSVSTALWLASPVPSVVAKPHPDWELQVDELYPAPEVGRANRVTYVFVSPAVSYPLAAAEPTTAARDSRSARFALLASLWDRIEGFSRLPPNWAGEGAVPASTDSTKIVGHLINGLPDDIVLPQATASSEGEIGLTWFKRGDRLEAIIDPDGYLTWVSKVGNNVLKGDVLATANADSDTFGSLYEALTRFYG